ncbi:hypothetical protein LUCX_248 [Xanthomonas phage vB_XciM_LucasX]|nr:hypothetical protein LUCX_248 [Xanthomonas phage vB_XciM_LucasX]
MSVPANKIRKPRKAITRINPNVSEIEEQILERERFRVILRLPTFLAAAHSPDGYHYKRALGDEQTIAHLYERLYRVFGEAVSFVVIYNDGRVINVVPGKMAHMSVELGRVRKVPE